jgi:hypothetical protein
MGRARVVIMEIMRQLLARLRVGANGAFKKLFLDIARKIRP